MSQPVDLAKVKSPRAGDWIETYFHGIRRRFPDVPSCGGLDRNSTGPGTLTVFVLSPRAGDWIETLKALYSFASASMSPRAGDWIETL